VENITVYVPEKTYRQSRIKAAEQISASALVRNFRNAPAEEESDDRREAASGRNARHDSGLPREQPADTRSGA